jgi:hypothetical protein
MMTVVVEASSPFAFQEIIIIGPHPIGFSLPLFSPPYRFSMLIPPRTRPGRYELVADGTIGPEKGFTSDPVDIQVERSDRPLKLTARPAVLNFMSVGHNDPITAVGQFVDDAEVNLSESRRVQYATDNPKVATVTRDGLVTATGPGSAKVTVTYNGTSVIVPVTCSRPPVAR